MRFQPAQVQVSENLTWESARQDDFLQDLECPPPSPISDYVPHWYKSLKGDLSQYRQDQWRHNHSARWCKGFQGIWREGWTIPLPVDVGPEQTVIGRKTLVPEMLYGTMWNEKDSNGDHVWDLTLMFWPWRARLSKGWRMMTTAYALDWSTNWFSFSGMPEANYTIDSKKNSIGNMYHYEQPLDTDKYDYFNVESVLATKRNTVIPKGTVTFTLLIIPPGE